MSLVALLLVAVVALWVWRARGSILGVALWIAIPLVVVAIFFPRSRESIGKVFAGAGRMAAGLVKSASSTAGGAVNATDRRRNYTVEIRTFRVVDAAGATHQCVLRGHLVGGSDLRLGDDVIVSGIRVGHGPLKVRRVEVVATGTSVSGRVPMGAQLARARQVLLVVLGVALAGYVVSRLR